MEHRKKNTLKFWIIILVCITFLIASEFQTNAINKPYNSDLEAETWLQSLSIHIAREFGVLCRLYKSDSVAWTSVNYYRVMSYK